MKTQFETVPTVAELNAIQDDWMALEPDAPEAKKRAVFAEMERYPRAYVSALADLSAGAPIVDGSPIWAERRPIRQALAAIKEFPGARCDVAWVGQSGRWAEVVL